MTTKSLLPEICFSNVAEYAYAWWAYGLRDPREVFHIQTSRYGLAFDYANFKLERLGVISNAPTEEEALTESNDRILNLPPASLSCAFRCGGVTYPVVSAGPGTGKCHLNECGKFFQRKILTCLNYTPIAPEVTSWLEVCAWPDRLAFVYHLRPMINLADASLSMSLELGAGYKAGYHAKGFMFTKDDGSGFAFRIQETPGQTPYDKGSNFFALKVSEELGKCIVQIEPSNWEAHYEKTVSLVVTPIMPDAASNEKQGLAPQNALSCGACPRFSSTDAAKSLNDYESLLYVKARQIAEVEADLEAAYDPEQGWYRVNLRNDGDTNDRIERVDVEISNPHDTPRVVRLNFEKIGKVFGIPGINAVLRDTEQNPTGIPVQLSKNWHCVPPWYRGLTMLTVPAKSKIALEYTSVSAHWGGVAAASHNQLALIGWNAEKGNQLWDQAAMGCWGENICFDPDTNLLRGMIDDVRPLMVHGMRSDEPAKFVWTNNTGGGDFLVYFDKAGDKQWNSRMRTMYRRNSPVLTEVTYAGRTYDGKIDLQCRTSLYRTDDLNRVLYRLRYDVREGMEFSRLAFFQLGADRYNDHQYRMLAYGNADGVAEEFVPEMGGNRYCRTGIRCPGRAPWFSLHQGISNDKSASGAWANRGLVIRSWKAKLGGKEVLMPHASLYGSTDGGHASASVEIGVPNDVKILQMGDFVELEIEHITMPQFARDYYGPNAGMHAALEKWEDTWHMIHREAIGNDLQVEATVGAVRDVYPVTVEVNADGKAEFSVTGGLGYVPIMLTGVPSCIAPILECRLPNNDWQKIDQSVHGKDYWQANLNPATGKWDIIYTVPMDTPGDERIKKDFRFEI